MMKLVLVFGVFGAAAFARDIPDVDMHGMTKEIKSLQKIMFSEPGFADPKNETLVRGAVPKILAHLTHLKEEVFQDQPALRMNTAMLAEQLADADRAFRAGNKAYARYTLVSSLQACVACHTRMASTDFVIPASEFGAATTLEKANFYFATRQFGEGRIEFEKFLTQAKKSDPPAPVRSSALALAVYYARVKLDPKGGADYFSQLARKDNFDEAQRSLFRSWADGFKTWPAGKPWFEEPASNRQAMAIARKVLKQKTGAPSDLIRDLQASSLLHEVLESPGESTSLKAEALLELGKIYEALDFPLYYRYGDMYLKGCVQEYQKTKAGRRCYRALAAAVKKRAKRSVDDGAANMEEVELFRWKKLAY